MSLDLAQVKKVAKLARLELSDADLAAMADQLNAILKYVDQLAEVNTDGLEPLAHPLPVANVFREDVPVPSLPVDAALQNAPTRLADFFGVPAVLDFVEASVQDKWIEEGEFRNFTNELFQRFGAKVQARLGGEPRKMGDSIYLLLLDPQIGIQTHQSESAEDLREFIDNSSFALRTPGIRFSYSKFDSH